MSRCGPFAVIALVLVGCSSSKSSAPTTATKAAIQATTTTSGVTVKQLASIVAKDRADILTQVENIDSGCSDFSCSPTAEIDGVTLSADAGILHLDMQRATQHAQPPAEVATLVADTLRISDDASNAALKINHCSNSASAPCIASDFTVFVASADALRDQLAAWDPYIG